ncbi:MAG: hypothetical protein ACTTKS_02355 [Bulleidia sp.]
MSDKCDALQERNKELEMMNDVLKLKMYELKKINDGQWEDMQALKKKLNMYIEMTKLCV